MRIAVIGGGIAGIAAAHTLSRAHSVCLIEAGPRLGGHANPVRIDEEPGRSLQVDTAFVIYNERSYPLFLELMKEWKVGAEIVTSDMSIGFFDRVAGFEYNTGSLGGFFPHVGSAFNRRTYRLLLDIARFRREALKELRGGGARPIRLLDFLGGYSRAFRDSFAIPLASLVWSMPTKVMEDLPLRVFLEFLDHHRHFDSVREKNWRSFRASSAEYLEAFRKQYRGETRLACPVRFVRPSLRGGVEATFSSGATEVFDRAVLAVHADQALSLLARPTSIQNTLLGEFKYRECKAFLHTDARALGARRAPWGCWNTTRTPGGSFMSYYLNRIHQLESKRHYFLSLDAGDHVDPARVIQRFQYSHPVFSRETVDSQNLLPLLNREGPIAFCGSYFGYGFHEDAVSSALQACREITRPLAVSRELHA